METLRNQQSVKLFIESIPNIKVRLDEVSSGLESYVECLKDELYEYYCENEPIEESIRKVETLYDRLDEMIRRNKITIQSVSDLKKVMNTGLEHINNILKTCDIDYVLLGQRNNEFVERMKELEKRKITKEDPYCWSNVNSNLTREEKQKLELKTKEFDEIKFNVSEMKEFNIEKNPPLDNNEIKQVEEWTSLKVGQILFDSYLDDWRGGCKWFGSSFETKLEGCSHILFLVEDDEGNKFGGYVNAPIVSEWGFFALKTYYTIDRSAFIFSLKSNGRLPGMMKFDVKDHEHAFAFSGERVLFHFGRKAIMIKGSNEKGKSYCTGESTFDFKGYKKALRRGMGEKNGFTPKRVVAIQMDDERKSNLR